MPPTPTARHPPPQPLHSPPRPPRQRPTTPPNPPPPPPRPVRPLALLLAAPPPAPAQDIEPRAYSNAPVGVNFFLGGYAYTQGSLATDPSVPLTDPHLATHSAVLGYGRVFQLWGQSAKINVAVPYSWLGGTAVFAGDPIQRTVRGLGDTAIRASVNLYGAPAMDLKTFRTYQQDLILGASLTLTAPTGQYDPSRLVNLGTNRWSIRPELGASKAIGPLTLELSAGPIFFTDNDNFLGGQTRSQAPILAAQAHAIYEFGAGLWAAFDALYFTGGSTAIDGQGKHDLQRNWRLGGTLAVPLNPNSSLKLVASSGVSARPGNNYALIGLFLQYRWGAGL